MMQLFFLSKSCHKDEEARRILEPMGIELEADHTVIHEPQTVDTEARVRDKAVRAFQKIGRLLFVEHTGLYLNSQRFRTIRSAKDIVDLHGDLSSPSTMVFTETSYFERLSFEAPLDVKLRADALGKSLLFIGYSLSDINIRYLLFRLQRQWEKEAQPELRPKAYVFMSSHNAVQSRVLRSRGVEPIVAETTNPSASLSDFLRALRRRADELSSLSFSSSTKK